MPSEMMRRPRPIDIHRFVIAFDRQLRALTPTVRRSRWPGWWRQLIRTLQTRARPLLQGGLMMVTSLAVVIAVGTPPVPMEDARNGGRPLAAPTLAYSTEAGVDHLASLPAEERLAAGEVWRNPDIPDIRRMPLE